MSSTSGDREIPLTAVFPTSDEPGTAGTSDYPGTAIAPDELVTAVSVIRLTQVHHARACLRAAVAPAAATVALALGPAGPRVALSVNGRLARVPRAEPHAADPHAARTLATVIHETATAWTEIPPAITHARPHSPPSAGTGVLTSPATDPYPAHAAAVLARRCHRALHPDA